MIFVMDTADTLNVSSILSGLSKTLGTRAALIDVARGQLRSASFAELEDEVNDAAMILRRAGVRALDVVLIYVPLQRELISLLLAVFRTGAQALFIDPTYGPGKVWHCLRLAKPKFLIIDSRLQAVAIAAPLLEMLGMRGLIIYSAAKKGPISSKLFIVKSAKRERVECSQTGLLSQDSFSPERFSPERFSPAHPALITFTSGSTGKPKGIVRSHGFLTSQSSLLQKTLPADPSGKNCGGPYNVMTTLPMFVLSALAAGQTAIIPAAGEEELLNQLKNLTIDRLLAAPRSIENICRMLANVSLKLPLVQQVIVGGGPVFPDLVATVCKTMPDAQIITVYGSTEAEPICHSIIKPPSQPLLIRLIKRERGLPLGRPIEEITLRVIDPRALGQRQFFTAEQFDALQLQADREGEIVVAGAHVVAGYLGGVGDSETKLNVGGRIFHRTGDAGYVTSEGKVFLTGRIGNGVVNGAETVYPLTVELMAMDNQGVERCAFVALGNKNILALQLRKGFNKEDVEAQLRHQFAQSKIKVDRFVVVNAMPVDERHQTKIVYAKLKKQLRFVS